MDSAGTEAPRGSHTKAMCEAGAGVVGDRGRSERVQSPGEGEPGAAVGICGQGRAFPPSLLWAASEVAGG